MLKKIILLGLALSILGCAGTNKSMQAGLGIGQIETNVSSFDGRTEVSMQPAFIKIDGESVWSGRNLKAGLDWFSTSPDQAVLTILIGRMSDRGSYDWQSIDSVDLNVDGVIAALEPLDLLTERESDGLTNTTCGAYGCTSGMDIDTSSKRFVVAVSTLESIVNANTVKVRISDGKEYFVGDIRTDFTGNITLYEQLPEFLSTISAQ